MNTKQATFPLTVVAAAVLMAYSPAYAQQDEELQQLTKPRSAISVGIGYVSADAPRFGQYTGLNDEGADEGVYGLLNVDVIKRDDSTGTWVKLNGRNLGLESRDLRFTHERQGNWGYYLDYSEIPRFEPYTVNTAVSGVGTPNLGIPLASAVEMPMQLKIKREAFGAGYSKILGGGFDLQVRARNENKDGARVFARGTPSSGSILGGWEFTPEPLNSSTRQLDVILGFNSEKWYLAGSYYGSWYNNHNTALGITGGAQNFNTTTPSGAGYTSLPFNPIGLPPDSQANQLALTGNYAFTKSTRANFKAAYTRATQDDQFISGVPVAAGIDPNGNLDGRVDTTLLQFGVSSRPTSKLSLLADVRYEDRDDKTPIRQYVFVTGTPAQVAGASFNGQNEPRSVKTTASKLEASYALPLAVRLTGGVEYVEKDRNTSPVRAVSYRKETEEISYRLMLQRSMAETVSGSVTYVYSDRGGSDFVPTTLNGGAAGLNFIAPLHLADRKRDKVRLAANWTPVEQLSVQWQTEYARDDYGHRTDGQPFELGLRDGTARNHSIDVSYALSDEWQTNAWISKNETIAHRAQRNGSGGTAYFWSSKLVNDAKSVGVGLRGKPFAKLEVGADLSHSEIDDIFELQRLSGAGALASLPSFYTRQSTAKLFGTYAVQKNASIRLDYVYDRYNSNDWTWSQWTYTDGTTLRQAPKQNVNFFGVTYIYRFY